MGESHVIVIDSPVNYDGGIGVLVRTTITYGYAERRMTGSEYVEFITHYMRLARVLGVW